MNRVLASIAAAAIALAGAASGVQAQTADDVVEKYLAAMGGRAALAKLTSQVATGTVAISVQGADIPGSVEISRKAPNKVRTFIQLDLSGLGGSGMTVDQRCDGKSAYAANSMQGDREITGSQLQGMLNNTFPTPLLGFKDAGGKVELVGRDTVGGRPVLALLYTPKAGPAVKMFFDAETFLVARTVTTVDVPEAGGPVEQTSDVADYRVVDGIKVPFSIKTSSPIQTVATTLSKVEFNTTLDDAIFSRPIVK